MDEFTSPKSPGVSDHKYLQRLQHLVDTSKRIVFFSGAGVSTESGIPDFRSAHGIYSERYRRELDPEQIVSAPFLAAEPETFFDFYRSKLIYPDARPNPAHLAVAALEKAGKLQGVVTQNIDGLDEMAGTTRVAELHGTTLRNYCLGCGREYSRDFILASTGIPRCEDCGEMVRPDVVLYGEGLDDAVFTRAARWIASADLLIVAGTSLRVYPAASLLHYFEGENLVLINKTATQADAAARLVIREPVGEVMGTLRI
ncbi:MAG: NAD-dependent protein deacylase [Ancrocorticia sp.]